MAATSSTHFVLFALSTYFLIPATAGLLEGRKRSVEGQLESTIFSVTSGNGSFNLDCGPECNRKLFLVATCNKNDTFMELIDRDLDVWLTKMENKLIEIEGLIETAPSKQMILESVEAIESKLQILEQKLLRVL